MRDFNGWELFSVLYFCMIVLALMAGYFIHSRSDK